LTLVLCFVTIGIVTIDFCSCERACRERGVSQTAGGKQPAQKAFFLIVRSSDFLIRGTIESKKIF